MAQQVNGVNGTIEPTPPRAAVKARHTPAGGKSRTSGRTAGCSSRYFLVTADAAGRPELGEELPNEAEAMIAALKRDGTYVSVSEWRVKVDTAGRRGPRIHKEETASKP